MEIMNGKAKGNNKNTSFITNPETIESLKQYRIVVIIPAYNEERFIGSVVLKLRRFPVRTILVDDGSIDATGMVAEAAGAQVIRHEQNRGKGEALNTGIHEARKVKPDVIVVIDGDDQHLVQQLPRLVQPILDKKADIVVGSRYLDKLSAVPAHRKFGHWFFSKFTQLTSAVKVGDSQSGYRAFSPKAFNTDGFFSSGFSVESEMQFLAHEYGLIMTEVPITIRYMDEPKRPVMQQGFTVLTGILRLIGQYRPLLFFGVPGVSLLAIGVIFGIWVVDIYSRIQVLAVGYAMISVLLSMVGMVLLSTGITLHSIRGLLIDMLRKNGHNDG
jgi:glycosyltransferase involved in cell wall biosynthesis